MPYGTAIPTGYSGLVYVEASAHYEELDGGAQMPVEYGYYDGDDDDDDDGDDEPPVEQYLKLELWGPNVPIQIGGWEVLQLGGTVTSQGVNVDGATVSLSVAGNSYQTSTGLSESGKFYYGWPNDTFPAGTYTVQVTVSKAGYQSATGTVHFTVFGEGYDFAVVMAPIPAVLAPGTNVPFPGTLTLGGNPVADWVQIDITHPNGTVESFSNLSDAQGHFTHTQPSLMELGNYQLVVYYQSDFKQISPVYTFTVGEGSETPPAAPPPVQVSEKCEIIDVVYPSMVLVGDKVNVTGKVICTQDEEEIIPKEGWNIHVFDMHTSAKAPIVQTSGDGSFAAIFPSQLSVREITILARDPEIETHYARWFGPLSVVVEIEPEISLSQTDYDQGEILEGTLTLNPNYPAENWDSGLEIFYQITGPEGAAAKQYLFESQYLYINPQYNIDNIVDRIYWMVPQDAGGGKYTLTAYISGNYIDIHTVETDFYVNDIQHTNLTAWVESDPDGWVSATLVGQFTDFTGVPIPDADVRVEFFIVKKNTEGTEIIGTREFKLTGTTDAFGSYEIDLEPLDLFVGQGQEDPWEPYWTTTYVYADKEGYATGAAIIDIRIPTVKARMEIISVNPPLDYLSKMSQGGLSYEQLTEMNIQVRVRYNNIFVEGAKLGISAQGNWAVNCDESRDPVNFQAHLDINGQTMPEWSANKYLDSWGWHQNMDAWPNGTLYPFWYYYPKHSVTMPAQHGIAQESTISVSGKLFGYKYNENSPNQCGGTPGMSGSPSIPPDWVVARPAIKISIRLGDATAVVYYNISPLSISASGSAWVSPTGGEFKGKLNVGQATGYALQKQPVNLSIVSTDLGVTKVSTDTEKTTSEIVIEASAITDDKGELKLSLTAKTNTCELEKKAKYYVKITSSALNGSQYIPVELRCVKELKFELNEDFVVVQATELSVYDPIQLASGKEAGVRAYLLVDGEIYQPENRPVQVKVKFEMFREGDNTPLFPQTKIFSLSSKGASVDWVGQAPVGSNAVTGEITEWLNPPGGLTGKEVIPLDFVFKPYQLGNSSTKYEFKITVDPDEVYGKSVSAKKGSITIKKMKRLQILFVPVDIETTPMSTINNQINFLSQTYPLGSGDIGWSLAKNFPTAEMYRKWALSKATLSWLGQIALNVGARYKSTSDANVEYKVVGIVAEDTWMEQPRFGSEKATGVYYSNGIALIKNGDKTSINTLAHELGHSFDLYTSSLAGKIATASLTFTGEQYEIHTPPGLPVTGHILRNGRIYLIPDDQSDKTQLRWIEAFGGDWAREKKKRDSLGAKYSNTRTVSDLMGNALGGQQESWVIPHTYNALFDKLKDPPGEEILIIQGGILDDNTAEFLPVWQSQGHADAVSEEGYYTLELQSSNGDVLYQTKFSLDSGWPGDSAIFAHQVPFKPGTASVVILEGNQIIGNLDRSSYSPEVQIVSQPVLVDETSVFISWTGADLDNDPLTYGLHYQCDNPNFWFTLAADLIETSYTFDAAGLPGGESCKIRVMATDGFNTAETIAEPFSVQAKIPEVQILNKEAVFLAGEQVYLHGAALDLEDGIIPSESLRWVSDIDGELGFGSSISVLLSPGTHHLTLWAEDSSGNFSMAETTIQIQNENILTRMGSMWVIGLLILAVLLGLGAIFILWLVLRNRGKPQPVAIYTGDQYQRAQIPQGQSWYQDPNTGGWSFWNGQAWQPIPGAPPPIYAPQQGFVKKQSGWGSCLLSLLIGGGIGLIVGGGISLVVFNFFPSIQIELGAGDLTQILPMGGGGLLATILGLLLLNGGFKAILTQRAIVVDERHRHREQRGCGAILNGLGQLVFGIVFLAGGVGLMTLAFYQAVLPWLGF